MLVRKNLLLATVKRRKLAWFGHVTRHDSLSKTILQGTVEGKRRRGRQKKAWCDNIKEWTGMAMYELVSATPPTLDLKDDFNESTTQHFKQLAWCHDLQGSDFIYTPTLYTTATRHSIAVAFIFLIIVTVIGNAFVIITVVVDKPLPKITRALVRCIVHSFRVDRKLPKQVVSMAASDILVALCGELQSVVTMLTTDAWVLSDLLCEVFTSADLYFSLSGILHIVCLAGDRYLAICYPFKYNRIDRKYLVVSVVCAWTLPLLFSFVPILSHWHRLGLSELYACLEGLEVHVCTMIPNKEFSTTTFIIMFGLPSIVMGFCYSQIYRTAMVHKEKMSTVTLGSYSSVQAKHSPNDLTPTEADETRCDHVKYTNVKDLQTVESRKGEMKQNHKIKSITFDGILFSEPCTFIPHISVSDPGIMLTEEKAEYVSLHRGTIQRSSYPGLTRSYRDMHFNSICKCPSMYHLSDYVSNPIFTRHHTVNFTMKSSSSNMSTRSYKTSPECNAAFSLASIPDKEEQFDSIQSDRTRWDYHLEENNEQHSCKHSPQNALPETKVLLKSGRRSEAGNGPLLPSSAYRHVKICDRLEKIHKQLKKNRCHLKFPKHGFLGEDFRTARSISIIIVCFAVTWCPYWITMLIMPYLGPGAVPDPLIGACLWLAYVGSALNPFVYYFSNNSVKKGIKKRFLRFINNR
ncbi:5-HT4 receptor [Elysia marginata]|uniref:5-HT4 receptor n=1 Tax=Elysia marginata TaxID=1093978 RepID=A0AAV4IF57_9GAST|nr:5-HT4 receptor [Elysia marginata]